MSLSCIFSLFSTFFFFFFNDTATTEIYTLSLHDALPIFWPDSVEKCSGMAWGLAALILDSSWPSMKMSVARSEEHTSELQSQSNLVCRLLLEKKKGSELSTFTYMTVRIAVLPASTETSMV